MPPSRSTPSIGKYRLLGEVGHGEMGIVYRAHDPDLNRVVAVKVLNPQLSAVPATRQQFLREGQTLAMLRHPHIVAVYDMGSVGGTAFIVMPLLAGESLESLVLREGALAPDRVVGLMLQIAKAVDHAHSSGVIHRDLKPSNVIVGPDGQATITDFGLAHALPSKHFRPSGELSGTIPFMAPELLRDHPPSPSTDIYALGVLTYYLLSGRLPFAGPTVYALANSIGFEEPLPLRGFSPHLSEAVEEVVVGALAKTPEARPATASAFAYELDEAVRVGQTSTPKPIRWRSLVPLLVGGLLALLLIGFLSIGTHSMLTVPQLAATGTAEVQRILGDGKATSDALATSEGAGGNEAGEPTAGATTLAIAKANADALATADIDARLAVQATAFAVTLEAVQTRSEPGWATAPPSPKPGATKTPGPTRIPPSPSSVGALGLTSPVDGSKASGEVPFRWSWLSPIGAGQFFDLQVCEGADCTPDKGITHTSATSLNWCVGRVTWLSGKPGIYRWRVVLVDPNTSQRTVATSKASEFQLTKECDEAPIRSGGGSQPTPCDPKTDPNC